MRTALSLPAISQSCLFSRSLDRGKVSILDAPYFLGIVCIFFILDSLLFLFVFFFYRFPFRPCFCPDPIRGAKKPHRTGAKRCKQFRFFCLPEHESERIAQGGMQTLIVFPHSRRQFSDILFGVGRHFFLSSYFVRFNLRGFV